MPAAEPPDAAPAPADSAVERWAAGVRAGDRGVLARAITLAESLRPEDRRQVETLLARLLPATGGAMRVGISGPPGVGKSTFIDALGMNLLAAGHRVAVLAVDPSSSRSGGSILGDKSRMPRLAADPRAYIRPSPSSLTLGGVARRTRESLLLCEAAGYDVVLVETVGVGQSEIRVAEMVDCFVVLVQPGAGDELQGIKKGILELADLVAINKADGDGLAAARRTAGEYAAAVRYVRPQTSAWRPRVVTVSALTGDGLAQLWELVEEHRRSLEAAGELARRRREQQRSWLWSEIEERLLADFRRHPAVRRRLAEVERAVVRGDTAVTAAAAELLAAFSRQPP